MILNVKLSKFFNEFQKIYLYRRILCRKPLKNIFIFLMLLILNSTIYVSAFEDSFCQDVNDMFQNEKIYVQPQDIYISEQGLFWNDSEQYHPVASISMDEGGIYFETGRRPTVRPRSPDNRNGEHCPNGHLIYHKECSGCAHWWCSFRCKCYSPWTKAK